MDTLRSQIAEQPQQSIPEYFAGKCILVTGATGFMGKILVEKLLRSCPDLANIYILIRNKKGKTPQERWSKLTEGYLFDKLKENNKSALDKVIVIEGDVTELGLGLSAKDREDLINNVSIVYHSAATVRFDAPLRDAIIMNVRGTREICKLVLEMKNILIFLHISTCYCQIGVDVLEEKLYQPRGNPYEAIEIAETMDDNTFNSITLKYLQGFPNTYSFTKCLSETLVKDMCEEKLPTVVFRPSIVSPAIIDPIPGYVDNINGSVSLLLGSGKGVIKTIPCASERIVDYCPVDAAIRGIIKATWLQSVIGNKIFIYNCSNANLFKYTIGDHKEVPKIVMAKKIWPKPLLEYNTLFTNSMFIYWMRLYWYQLVPGIFFDAILKLLGKKPMILKLLAKLTTGVNLLLYFSCRNWNFVNKKFIELDDFLSKEDDDNFGDCMHLFDKENFVIDPFINICKILKEGDLKENYKVMKRRSYIYFVWNNAWRIIFGIMFYNNILLPFYHTFVDYLIAL